MNQWRFFISLTVSIPIDTEISSATGVNAAATRKNNVIIQLVSFKFKSVFYLAVFYPEQHPAIFSQRASTI